MQMRLLLLLACLLFSGQLLQAQNVKMKKAFNGKNLKGWVEPENNMWWTAEGGILSAKSDPEQKGSILWTQKSFQDFVIELDFKMGDGTVDSGIFMRGDKKDAPQIQIGISGSLKRDMTGSPYVPGQGYPVEAEGVKELLKPDDWNTMRAQAVGNVYTVWLNGKKVMTYEMENPVLEGPIGLQLHPGRDMSIDFRNIKVGKL